MGPWSWEMFFLDDFRCFRCHFPNARPDMVRAGLRKMQQSSCLRTMTQGSFQPNSTNRSRWGTALAGTPDVAAIVLGLAKRVCKDHVVCWPSSQKDEQLFKSV